MNDLTLGYAPIPNLKLQMVIDNVFNRQEPFPLPATPSTSNNGNATSTYFSGDFPVGIQRYIFGRALIAFSEVDRLQLAIEG